VDDVAVGKRKWLRGHAQTVLVEAASSKQTITYTELSERLPIHVLPKSQAMSRMLSEISRRSYEEKKVLLSAVVVRAEDGVPGDGFWDLALELGEQVDDQAEFWERSLDAVYEAYRQT
jgi:hypothetical protein